MKRFKKILVGVDLASDHQIVADKFSDATEAAIKSGLWLAKHNDAKLVFLSALEIPDYARFVSEEQSDVESCLIEDYEDRLSALVQRAKTENVASEYLVAFGKSWVELIRQVLKQQHELVIIGTRQRGVAASELFGSTGMKLLRKCPCPVWITKPREQEQIRSILVADDLTPVSNLALELGVSMAGRHGSKLHVLHALELGLGMRKWDSFNIRKRVRAEATQKLAAQMARVDVESLSEPPSTEIVVDSASAAITKCIEHNGIELLVMGTIARGGVAGVLTGNTAERLLPCVPCSVLAVKPHDFICPIAVE